MTGPGTIEPGSDNYTLSGNEFSLSSGQGLGEAVFDVHENGTYTYTIRGDGGSAERTVTVPPDEDGPNVPEPFGIAAFACRPE